MEKINSQMFIDKFTKVNYYKRTTKRVTKVTGKEDDMRTNYMMTVDDVMEELGVKRSKAYSILKQLNDELAKEGYVAVRGKIPRPYWETKFYGCSQRAV